MTAANASPTHAWAPASRAGPVPPAMLVRTTGPPQSPSTFGCKSGVSVVGPVGVGGRRFEVGTAAHRRNHHREQPDVQGNTSLHQRTPWRLARARSIGSMSSSRFEALCKSYARPNCARLRCPGAKVCRPCDLFPASSGMNRWNQPEVRRCEGSRVRGCEGSRVRGCDGSRVRGFEGSRVRRFEVHRCWFMGASMTGTSPSHRRTVAPSHRRTLAPSNRRTVEPGFATASSPS